MVHSFSNYDQWKLATPPEYEWPTGRDADPRAEDRSRIDDMTQTATTAADWLAVCRYAKSIGDEPPITTSFDPKPIPDRRFDWSATRADYEPPLPVGFGRTEAEAIADLLQWED